jgi:hypothetical protein
LSVATSYFTISINVSVDVAVFAIISPDTYLAPDTVVGTVVKLLPDCPVSEQPADKTARIRIAMSITKKPDLFPIYHPSDRIDIIISKHIQNARAAPMV